MKRTLGLITTGLLVAVVSFSTLTVGASPQTNVLATILDKMTKAGDNLHSLKATLSQQKINTQLGIKDAVESGTLYYRPLKNGQYQLRIDYTSPEPKILVIDGDKFFLYQPNINQIIKSSIEHYASSHGETGFSFRFDTSMKAQYNISYVRDENVGGVPTSVIAFVPKPGAAPFKRMEQWVDQRTWLPIKLQITEKNNDLSWVQFGNMSPNAVFGKDTFTVNPKHGTKIVNG